MLGNKTKRALLKIILYTFIYVSVISIIWYNVKNQVRSDLKYWYNKGDTKLIAGERVVPNPKGVRK